jgi:Haem-binding domain
MKRYIIWLLIALPFVIQLFRPSASNTSNDNTYHIGTKYPMTSEINKIMKDACYDCHSNLTVYPKYFNYQPMGWFLASHIKNGKKQLNFSEFTKRRIAVQNHKFEEIIEMTESQAMPIGSYTYFGLHPEAKLTIDQRNLIINWAKAQMDILKNQYPIDSLKLKH